MDLVFATLIGLASSGGICYYGYQSSKQRKEFKILSSAETFSPSSLISKIHREGLRNFPGVSEYSINAFVEGRVSCQDPLRSVVRKGENLVYSLYERREIYEKNLLAEALGLKLNDVVERKVNAARSFTLEDRNSPHSCVVHRNLEVDPSQALQKIGEVENKKLFEKFVNQLGQALRRTASASRDLFSMRIASVGFTEAEFGIKVGSLLTVYGQFVYNLKDKTLRIESPMYFLKSPTALLTRLKERIDKSESRILLLLVPLVISAIYLWKKGSVYLKEREEKKLRDLKRSKDVLNEDYTCAICMDHPKNLILKPCMHFCICKNCFKKLPNYKCPICKAPIEEILAVYH